MKKVLYIVEDKRAPQFRYRVENLMEVLRDSDEWKVEYVLKSGLDDLELETYSLIVIERQTAKDNLVLKLTKKAKRVGIKVLFDIDDLVFDYRDLKLVYSTVGEKNIFYWAGYFWGIRRIAKRVDGFLCTNDYLGRKLKKSFGKPYKVIPNSLNKKQVDSSEKIKNEKKSRGCFLVGYFSGSPTHANDFRLIEPELIGFLKSHDDVTLKVIGDMSYSDEMKRMIDDGRVKAFAKVDYLKLLELIAKVDVNLAPLIVNDFTNCKSELKFFEAAVVETTTIASPTYVFKKAISDGENGFLARVGEWQNKLEYLYEHPEENRKIAKRAYEYVLKHYYGKEFSKEVEAAYNYFGDGK